MNTLEKDAFIKSITRHIENKLAESLDYAKNNEEANIRRAIEIINQAFLHLNIRMRELKHETAIPSR